MNLATKILQSDQILVSVLNALPYAFVIKDDQGNILFKNSRYSSDSKLKPLPNKQFPELQCFTGSEIKQEESDSELLQILAHQLRTPVTGVVWNAELAEEAEGEHLRDLLDNIKDSGSKLKQTVADLILAMELHSGKTHLKKQSVPIKECITDAANSLDFQDKSVSVKLVHNGLSPSLQLDRQLFTTAIKHIMQNSIDYCKDDLVITITLSKQGNLLSTTIQDNGPGLDDPAEAVIQRFFRGKDSRTKKPDGSGLGLYIAQQSMQLHDGDLVLSSDGSGTSVTLTIPL